LAGAPIAPETRLKAFQAILAMEAETGYRDRAVSGGLERFLQTLLRDQKLHPRLQSLADHGMLTVAYGELDSRRREAWVGEADRLLGGVPIRPAKARSRASAPATGRAAPIPAASVGLASPVTVMRSVSRATAVKLQRLGVSTLRDLIYLFPKRHIDYSQRSTVSQLQPGREQTVVVSLWEAHQIRLGRGGQLQATEAVVGDDTGNIRVVWFGQPYLARTLERAMARPRSDPGGNLLRPPGQLVLSGKVASFMGRRQMESPEWEVLEDPEMADLVHTGRLVPVYPATEGLQSQRTLRRIVREALDVGIKMLEDSVPLSTLSQRQLMPLAKAVSQAHYPDSADAYEMARRRLAFDELLVLLLAMAASKGATQEKPRGIVLRPASEVLATFLGSLPFKLTPGQRSALDDGLGDIGSAKPMSRLLQGDVGSGKTVVALGLLLTAIANGYQGVFMAPTEVLAEQHYLTVGRLLNGLAQPSQNAHSFSVYVDPHPRPISIGLLTGSTPAAARRELQVRIDDGAIDLLIGTHALIQEKVSLSKLALAVVDEQHRFGVMQRAALRGKGREPHLLVMSATPIPRTLALTLYADLEVSTIPELPAGRRPITTRFVPPERRDDAEAFLVTQASEGRQSFVVCPLIDESEAIQARAATEEYERLRTTSLSSLRVGLLHGRMPLRDKQTVMENFRQGELDVLVATPVIEVGIDVPNATVMLIEGADRFGLSQLHQLRGRVGRSEHQSYCLLLAEAPSEEAQRRLETVVGSNDGFEIAEADLRLRGPGDFFGTRQSGLPTLRMARLSDRDLLVAAREEARRMMASDPKLKAYPSLAALVERYAHAVTDEVS
jgi:ATP-dependent DNA helicase RecG